MVSSKGLCFKFVERWLDEKVAFLIESSSSHLGVEANGPATTEPRSGARDDAEALTVEEYLNRSKYKNGKHVCFCSERWL